MGKSLNQIIYVDKAYGIMLEEIFNTISDLFLILLLVISAYTDLRKRKILNFITFPAIVIGLILNLIFGGWDGLLNGCLGFLIGFTVFFLLYVFGGMGGGDVKLMGAIGAIKGFPFIIDAMFLSIFCGGILAVIVIIRKGAVWISLKRIFRLIVTILIPGLKTEHVKKEDTYKIPYGFCIALGTFIALSLIKIFQLSIISSHFIKVLN